MFTYDSDQVFRAGNLSAISALSHGFGSRNSAAPEDSAWLRQIHSDVVVEAENSGCLGEGDGLVTARRGVLLSVRTADCVPLLLADPDSGVIGAVHAGWRGVISGIAPKVVTEMVRLGADPERILIAIGPAIGPCCFEVGPEVASQFRELLPEREDLSGRVRLDLHEILYRELTGAGVPDGNISHVAACTRCQGEVLHSFRRDREASGRQHSWIQWGK